MEFPFKDTVALVTGASRGIGAAFARELARCGIGGLVLVARAKDDLEELASEIRLKYALAPNAPLVVLPIDLSDPDAPACIKAETDRRGITVDLLVNNAGFGSHGFFHETSSQKEMDMIQVNISSLVALTRLYLPEMIERKRGAILNVGSTAAFQAVPYMATYAATKAFVQSFSEALWGEMQECGSPVKVLCVCPGGTATNFADGLARGRFENIPHDTPETVARVGLEALSSDAPYVVVGALNQLSTQMPRLLPRSAITRIAGALFRPIAAEDAPIPAETLRKAAIGTVAVAAGVTALAISLSRRART